MPSYSTTKPLLLQAALTTTLTGTASGHVVTNTNIARLPAMFKGRQWENIKVRITTAPVPTGSVMSFLNGTNTFATVSVGTATAGQFLDATMVPNFAKIAGGVAPTVSLAGTATASAAQAAGVYDIWGEI